MTCDLIPVSMFLADCQILPWFGQMPKHIKLGGLPWSRLQQQSSQNQHPHRQHSLDSIPQVSIMTESLAQPKHIQNNLPSHACRHVSVLYKISTTWCSPKNQPCHAMSTLYKTKCAQSTAPRPIDSKEVICKGMNNYVALIRGSPECLLECCRACDIAE